MQHLIEKSELTNFITELKSHEIKYLNICCGFVQAEHLYYEFSSESCLKKFSLEWPKASAIPIDTALARILIGQDLKYAAQQFLGTGAYSLYGKSGY